MRTLLMALVCWAVISAGPVRAEDTPPRTIENWGTVIDPVGDCRFLSDGETLAIVVPGAMHDLWPNHREVNSPLVLQPVEGDFRVQVKVAGSIDPQPGTALERYTFQAGTIVVWHDDRNFVRLDRVGEAVGESVRYFCFYHVFEDGERVVQHTQLFENSPTLLRIECSDGDLTGGFSQDDGVTWQNWEDGSIDTQLEWRAGVSVVNTTTESITVQFEELQIEDESP